MNENFTAYEITQFYDDAIVQNESVEVVETKSINMPTLDSMDGEQLLNYAEIQQEANKEELKVEIPQRLRKAKERGKIRLREDLERVEEHFVKGGFTLEDVDTVRAARDFVDEIAEYSKIENEVIRNKQIEAVKEFAEILKNDWIGNLYHCEDLDITDWIDELVEETMKGQYHLE